MICKRWNFICIISLLIASMQMVHANDEWDINCIAKQTHKNLTFIFEKQGQVWLKRDSLIQQCLRYIDINLKEIGLQALKGKYEIRFTNLTGDNTTMAKSKGVFDPWLNKVSFSKGVGPLPIQHELMHLVLAEYWGVPQPKGQWLNEGFVTYIEDNCSGYSIEEVYAVIYFRNSLLKTEDLRLAFYKQKDIIAYFQSAYMVQYLIDSHGLDKLKALWMHPNHDMKTIYGYSMNDLKIKCNQMIKNKYQVPPKLTWEAFIKKCD